MRYRVYHVAFDMDGLTEGDLNDFRRALDALESDFQGAHLLGTDCTATWPTVVVRESVPEKARRSATETSANEH